MNNVNKTLYIPLYGKSFVSKKGIILSDKKAEFIWEKEGFSLKGKSKSKWLAYYMAMRSRVFDEWLLTKLASNEEFVILHIGCGMDSRVQRVGVHEHGWYDVDFEEVINQRKTYYQENEFYHMINGDLREESWLKNIPPTKKAVVILEGISMYLELEELKQAFLNLSNHFESLEILMDCYTEFAAKASKYKNPINDVGVTQVHGIDDPEVLEGFGISYVKEHDLTPTYLIEELKGMEKFIFENLFAGKVAKNMYRLYEFKK